jgi:urea transport system ATP-binding protein
VILDVRDLSSGYDKSMICFHVHMHLAEGERVCLLGRNGVGKTTLLRTIMGLLPAASGTWQVAGREARGLATHRIARMGVSYVPQGRGILGGLSVRDNLRLGTVAEAGKISEVDEQLFDYFPVLKERLTQKAGTLSGGEQQMLSIARALASRPRLILLDEPSEGLQPNIVQRLRTVIQQISLERGLAILVVEQNLDFALDLSTRGYVMEKGSIVEQGSVGELRNDEIVRQYLGV